MTWVCKDNNRENFKVSLSCSILAGYSREDSMIRLWKNEARKFQSICFLPIKFIACLRMWERQISSVWNRRNIFVLVFTDSVNARARAFYSPLFTQTFYYSSRHFNGLKVLFSAIDFIVFVRGWLGNDHTISRVNKEVRILRSNERMKR